MTMTMDRKAGLLLHPTSLPGAHGIGELGWQAHHTLQWIAGAGFRVWQVLPLGPTGYGDSPYACFSAFAGNPCMIDTTALVEAGWLPENDLNGLKDLPTDHVDFGRLIPEKTRLLKQAFLAWDAEADEDELQQFEAFRREHEIWLNDYTLFMAIKDSQEGKVWNQWPAELRDRDTDALMAVRAARENTIRRIEWEQFIFNRQWTALRKHARELGVQFMGDAPIFVAYDSADVWANKELFKLDEKGAPTVVAGVPPDYFSATGQRWGNPLYNWPRHQETGFHWWTERIRFALKMVDLLRIDHFRGFVACWEIPADHETAEQGEWVESPGEELFRTIDEKLGKLPLIAEDLGVITPEVTALRKQFGMPGMRILQFAWGGERDNSFLPHNHEPDSMVYTGTHDNNTTVGWWQQEVNDEIRGDLAAYQQHGVERPHEDLWRMALQSVADYAVAPMQDLLGLNADHRMNRPGAPQGNWSWRVKEEDLNDGLKNWQRELLWRFGRLGE